MRTECGPSVHQRDDTRLRWRAGVAGQEKEWTAEITEQVPDTRIAWESLSGASNRGAASFEPAAPDLTRITLRLDYEPEGFIENLGDVLGMVGSRVQRALDAFREFLEGRVGATGAWRGRIHGDGAPLPRPEVPPAEAPVKGSEVRVTRCAIHGVAFDQEREVCPECAKAPAA